MSRKINIGFIGCGEISQIMHIPYVHESGVMNVYSLCNTSPTPLKFMAERYHIPSERCYTNYKELLQDPQLDAVAICTHDHYAQVLAAAAAHKHIFVEKPLAFNTRQAEEMVEAADRNGVVLQVGYMKPYDPGFEYFLSKFKEIKEISHVRMHNFSGDYTFIPHIYDLCTIHEIDEATRKIREKEQNDAIEEEIRTDSPMLKRAYMNMLLGTSHDSILLRLMFNDNSIHVRYADIAPDGQILAILESKGKRFSWESHFITDRMKWDENMYVYSPECELSLHFPSPYLRNAVTKVKINENEEKTGANRDIEVTASYDESYRREWQAFYRCIIDNEKPLADGYGGLCVIRLASEIIRMAKQNLD